MSNNYEDMYNSLRRLHESSNLSINLLQQLNTELQKEVKELNEKLINAQKNVDINKEIVRNTLIEQNKMKDDYAMEIAELRETIKRLKKAN